MSARQSKSNGSKKVENFSHEESRRTLIPTAEYQSVMADEEKRPIRVAYERRNRDLDPQLVWRGKDEQDWSDLVVSAPPLYIQEKVHPRAIIQDLVNSEEWIVNSKKLSTPHYPLSTQLDLFADFNGLPKDATSTDFYQHEANWTNRMILGDSLQVMASLAEREGLRGKVQCIYIDPPYGIRFNSNFQWSTTSRDVKDGKVDQITREPEQVKAFRDTWRDGIHSYLTYLRDRLTVARDLLTDSGSIFVQIGDENVHRIRGVMDEIFGENNFYSLLTIAKTSGTSSNQLDGVCDFVVWYARSIEKIKYRQLFKQKEDGEGADEYRYVLLPGQATRTMTQEERNNEKRMPEGAERFRPSALTSQRPMQGGDLREFEFQGKVYKPGRGTFKTDFNGLKRLSLSARIIPRTTSISYLRKLNDFPVIPINNVWMDTRWGFDAQDKRYIVETNTKVLTRCILMTTDPGDLVLDPTCGSGTTAYVAEQWGRRWITIDTSRVALALARARIMGARYNYYLLADSPEGQQKEAEIVNRGKWIVDSKEKLLSTPHYPLSTSPTYRNIRQGFVYDRVPHITLKSIANNTEIDVIWDKFQAKLEPLRQQLNTELGKTWEEWEIPREADQNWSQSIKDLHQHWWQSRIDRQTEIDASIAAKADQEFLYDKPFEDKSIVRVAGPFTVESLSPHRVLAVDENDELIDPSKKSDRSPETDFATVILENLRTAGVQQAHKEDKIGFTSIVGWAGNYICAEGRYLEGEKEKRAGIFIGPEFGTVSRPDLVAATREAGDAGFDVLIACAFSFDAHSADFNKLGRIPVLKARMNADLHMAGDLKNTGSGNLFVIFGEPDIEVASEEWLVNSLGVRVAPYEIFKLVSGVNSLAEINRLSSEDLWRYSTVSCRREVWDYITDATGSNLNLSQHRRGASQENEGGVSTVSWHCTRLTGRTRNLSDFVREAVIPDQNRFRELIERLCRDQQNATRSHEISIHSPLTTNHYSQVKINGVDVFRPQSGEVESSGADGIACWFIDTDYNEESFFVRHAYFLGANDPYKSLKTTLKAEIDEAAWETLYSDTSRPFDKPKSGRIAVKVINHLGDEVMKVFSVN